MEKKIRVEMNGRIVRVMKHCLDDVLSLGGSTLQKSIKNPPKELSLIQKPREIKVELKEDITKEPILPDMKVTKKPEIELVREQLDKLGVKYHPNTGLEKLKAKLDERVKE